MNSVIQLLPDSLANQIAAGEVIQRPASVVKELLENALDARATVITLIIKDSGKTLIQVVDNGVGMSETDARLCLERHATSKIKSSDDLFRIKSFGFRGEAMASIAAISYLEVATKRKEDELGTYILVEGSHIKKQEPRQLPNGTSFTVRNLFYNVPARRKFLKSDPVELKHILEEFTRIALPNPDVFFSVYHNDNELYHFTSSNLRQRITNYFGKNSNENIVPVSEETDFIKISGFIGKPELTRKTRGDQYLFVNKRFIKSNYLNHAIKLAYDSVIPPDHFPFYVLLLDIDPAMIDVNIHPTKQEVKFENERLIYNYVKVAVKHALGKYSITPSIDFDTAETDSIGTGVPRSDRSISKPGGYVSSNSLAGNNLSASLEEKKKWIDFYQELGNTASEKEREAITLSSDWTEEHEDQSLSTKSFQIHDSYIISPIKSGWIVLDQSASHERVLYERYREQINRGHKGLAQTSLFPETIQLKPTETAVLETISTELRSLGFRIEKFGQNTFVINALPSESTEYSPKEFIEEVIFTYISNQELQISVEENLARTMAKKMSIKKGRKLEPIEMQELIDQLFACQMPYVSPSGHKCFVTYDLKEVEQRLKSN